MKQLLINLTIGSLIFGLANDVAKSQTVEKVADLSYLLGDNDLYQGGTLPLSRFTQVGTDLWFTTSTGGTNNLGTISRFDLNTHQVIQVANLDASTGYSPASELLAVGTTGYFTTTAGGTGGLGTISQIDLASGAVTALFSLPASLADGQLPSGHLALIGSDLWVLSSAGGSTSAPFGVAFKYNLTSATATVVTNFTGAADGAQPFGGLIPVGSDYYFTTLQGGNTWGTINYPVITLPDGSTRTITNRVTLGTGTLGKLTLDGSGNPIISTAATLQGGYGQFASSAPILVGTNSIYLTTLGLLSPNAAPGAIVRYDLDTGFLTNLFIFPTNPIPFAAYGIHPGYASPTEWQGELYLVNKYGGAHATALASGNGGTIIKYNIASNTVTKLADLGNAASPSALGSPVSSSFFGAGLVVLETNRFYLYQLLPKGGANGYGTIIRIALPPQPIQLYSGLPSGDGLKLSWSGGYPPFDVLTNSDLTQPDWGVLQSGIDSSSNTTNWSATLPTPASNLFFRIRGQSQ